MDTQLQQLQDYRKQATQLIFPTNEGILDQIARIELELEVMTPIEKQHREELNRQLFELKLSMLGVTETLPYEPLRLRNEQGQPIFAIYNIMRENPVFCLEVKVEEYGLFPTHKFQVREPSEMPHSIDECFIDMDQHLRKRIRRGLFGRLVNDECSMSTRYVGLIPQYARDKIREVTPLISNVYLIAEANGWEYKTAPAPRPIRQVDPLVVAFAFRKIYLITSFDPTSPEQVFLDSSMTGS